MKKHINIRWQLVAYDLVILAAIDLLLLMLSGEELSPRGVAIQVTIALTCEIDGKLEIMKKHINIRWQLVAYDLVILAAIDLLLLMLSGEELSPSGVAIQVTIALLCIFAARMVGNVYGQIWRYGGIQCYIRLIVADMAALVLTFAVERSLPIEHISFARLGNVYGQIWRYGGIQCYIRLIVADMAALVLTFAVERSLPIEHISFARLSAIANMNLLCCLAMRMFYRYAFKCGNETTVFGTCCAAWPCGCFTGMPSSAAMRPRCLDGFCCLCCGCLPAARWWASVLCCLAMRMFYRYAFKCGNETTVFGRFLLFVLRMFAGSKVVGERTVDATKINIAIIGAGRVGVSLAEELLNNAQAAYSPRCFVDVSREKVGRDIHNIPVLLEDARQPILPGALWM